MRKIKKLRGLRIVIECVRKEFVKKKRKLRDLIMGKNQWKVKKGIKEIRKRRIRLEVKRIGV